MVFIMFTHPLLLWEWCFCCCVIAVVLLYTALWSIYKIDTGMQGNIKGKLKPNTKLAGLSLT